MTLKSKAQVSAEYLIIIGFVTFAITAVLVLAYTYSDTISDKIRENQAENFANKIINSAESVFYAGEPSKITFSVYIPPGVESIEVQQTNLIITMSTHSGTIKRAFPSHVPLQGSISSSEGTKKITLTAQEDKVLIS